MLQRGARGLALSALLLGVAAVPASATSPPVHRSGFLGVNFTTAPSVSPLAAERMRRTGVSFVRFSLPWFGIEARENVYEWAAPDTTIGDLASHGIRAMPVLFGTPYWATAVPTALPPSLVATLPALTPVGDGTAFPPNDTPKGSAGWVAFVTAAVRRYGPNGAYWRGPYQREHPGAHPLPVRTWEVWNEPNLPYFFWPHPSAEKYASLLEMSHDAIVKADPGATVALGGLACRVRYSCTHFLDDLYAQPGGIRSAFDLVSLHAYAPTAGANAVDVRRMRHAMRAHGDARKPIWVSEFGWGSSARRSEFNVGPRGQALRLRHTANVFERLRRRLGIWRLSWFQWQDPPQRHLPKRERNANGQLPCDWCPFAGLLDPSGNAKPALRAFRAASRSG